MGCAGAGAGAVVAAAAAAAAGSGVLCGHGAGAGGFEDCLKFKVYYCLLVSLFVCLGDSTSFPFVDDTVSCQGRRHVMPSCQAARDEIMSRQG